jgi:hypothetical protein
VLLISTCVFQATRAMDAEPLLACVTMGMYLVNRRSERAERDGEELHAMIAHIMSFSNVAFFGLAGASLKLVGGVHWAAAAACCVLRRCCQAGPNAAAGDHGAVVVTGHAQPKHVAPGQQ